MDAVFTAAQAKAARLKAGISQGRVATDLGINRSYMSLFEAGKYLFNDDTLKRVRRYYEQSGGEFPTAPALSAYPPRAPATPHQEVAPWTRDGFVIPPSADDEEVERLLSEYATNRDRIDQLATVDLRSAAMSFFGLDETRVSSGTTELLALMARNYLIVEKVQGHPGSLLTAQDDVKTPTTTGQFVAKIIDQTKREAEDE